MNLPATWILPTATLHQLFVELKESGVTFLVVTHNPQLVKLGDKVFEMKDGQISQ